MKTKLSVVLFALAMTLAFPARAFVLDFNLLPPFLRGPAIDITGNVLGKLVHKAWDSATREAPAAAATTSEVDNSSYADRIERDKALIEQVIQELTARYPEEEKEHAKQFLLQKISDLAETYPSVQDRLSVLGYRVAAESSQPF